MPDIFLERCCMCPVIGDSTVCPPKYLEREQSVCRFVNTYTDGNVLYKVLQTGEDCYQVCQRDVPAGKTWGADKESQAYDSFDEAQMELNETAVKMGWSVIYGDEATEGAGGRKYQVEKEGQ